MSGQLDRSAMTALQHIAGSTTQGAITTGTFEFDEATMRGLVDEWLTLAEEYDQSLDQSVSMVQIEGPGLDFASASHADAANASGRAYLAYLQRNRDYCLQQAQLSRTRFTTISASNTSTSPRSVIPANPSTTVLEQESDMRTRSLTLLLGLAVLAGCTSTSEGTPRPATGDTAETTSESSGSEGPDGDELPFAGAPEVNDPLDTERFQQDPCQSLTATQAQELVVTFPGTPYDGALGKACKWGSPRDRMAAVDVRFLSKDPRGLSALYLANERGGYVYFDELEPIEGYPAVARDGVDDRDIGKCTVVTGTSDEDAFELILRLSQVNVGTNDPCETAAMVAEMVLRTMKENS